MFAIPDSPMNLRKMKKIITVVLLFNGFIYASDPYPRNPAVDVQHYKFKIEVSDAANKIAGEAELTIKFTRATKQFYLDLVGESGRASGMKVSSIISSSAEIAFAHKSDRLLLKPDEEIPGGSILQFRILYEGIPNDGLVISTNKYGDRTFFGDNWPDRARHWLPSVDHPSDKASCEFIVVAPNHYQVIGNGVKLEQTNLDGNRMLTHWREQVAIPTKVMVIGIARFAVTTAGFVNHIPVETWVYPQNKAEGFYDFKIAIPVLDYFQQHIGPYPYQKLANVQSTTRFGGMENASNIFYFENSVTGKSEREDLVAHEVAHQWFGDSASEDDWYHVWLSEGFATYFTNLYLENRYGRDKLIEKMREQREAVVHYHKKSPAPVIDTSITDINRVLNTNAYQKGGWFLHMLRHRIGDDAFWQGIREYYKTYKNDNALTEDLRAIMEKASETDLNGFFQQWLERPGHPVLDLNWKYNAKAKKLDIEVRQKQEVPFEVELDLGVDDQAGNREVLTLRLSEANTKLTVDMPNRPEKVVLDPETWLLYEPVSSNK